MNKSLKRVFASFMTLAISVCFIPTFAFAAEGTGWSNDHSKYFYTDSEGNVQKAEATVSTVDATCSEDGSVTYTVDVDGVEPYVETIPATGNHTAGDAVHENEKNADCEEAGSYDEVVYCTVCGTELSRDTKSTEATGHTPGEAVQENVVEATCTEAGSYDEVVYCTDCNKELSREAKTSEPVGHDWELAETTKAATCIEEGEGTYKCTRCGETKTDSIEKVDHTWGEAERVNVVAATCTEGGSYDEVVKCEVCGEVKSTENVKVNALGHKYDEGVETTPATCSEEGVMTYTCTVCGDTYTEPIEKLEHTPGEPEKLKDNTFVAPTCTEEGSQVEVVKCTVCGEEISRETKHTDALGHDFSVKDEEASKAATCEEDGINVLKCSRCDETTEEVVPATGHTAAEAVQEKVIDATCTEAGSYEEVIYCADCGEEMSRETKSIEALGHTPAEAVQENVIEPTCTEAGSHEDVVYCEVCGEELSRDAVTDEAVGHEMEIIETKEPTCTKEGAQLEKCKVCGTVEKTVLEATGHTEGEAVQENVVKATCTEDGSYEEVIYCTVCGDEISREAKTEEALGHDFSVKDEKASKPAACEEEGLDVMKCSRCDETESVVVPATGHNYSQVVKKEATCEEDGSAYGKCENCGDLQADIVIPKLGHDYSKAKVSEITWSAEDPSAGYAEYEYVCKNDPTHVTSKIVNFTAEDAEKDYTVTTKSEITKEATCEEAGETTYTVTFAETINGVEFKDTNTYTEEIAPLGHELADAVKENVVEATCEEGGSYDLVQYCSTCGKEMNRSTVKVEATGHTAGEPVVENEQNKDSDTEDYTYDSVTYCESCGAELKREEVRVPASGHKPADPVVENRVEPTCTETGSYESVVYCEEDGVELSRTTIEIEAKGHTPADAVIENSVPATCMEDGSYDLVVYCADCGEELSREAQVDKAAGEHSAFFTKTGVETEQGYIADVTYCGICFEEIARQAVADTAAYDETNAKAVQEALDTLNGLLSDKNATAEDIAAAEAALVQTIAAADEAKDNAEAKAAEEAARAEAVTDAQDALEAAADVDDTYPADEAKAVADAKAALEEVVADENATAEDIAAATEALYDAIDAAEEAKEAADDAAATKESKDKAAATVAGQDALDEAAKVDTSAYAAEDAKAIKDAQTALKVALSDPTATSAEIKAATDALNNAVKTAEENKAAADKAAAEKAAAEAAAAAEKAAAEAAAAAAAIDNTYPDAEVKAVKDAKAALDTALASGDTAAIAAATAALNKSVDAAKTAKAKVDTAKKAKTKIKVKSKKGKKAVVSWKAVKGVSGYKVYRATKKNGKYKLVKTIKNAKKKKFTNKKLKKGKKYFYKVVPYTTVSGKTIDGKASNIKKIKAKK